MERHEYWLLQAESDYNSGLDLLKNKHYSQVCFTAQQVAEKCLKAIAYSQGFDLVKSHSIVNIAKELKLSGDLEQLGKRLDIYYISARYPDALPDNVAPTLAFGYD